MARPNTRQTLIDYCLRNLGHPVIEINVDDDQLDDRVDEALQFFSEYHFDGVEKVYLKYQITATDVQNGYISLSYNASSPNQFTGAPGASGQREDQMTVTETGSSDTVVNIENLITSVLRVWQYSAGSMNMFDVRYQYALNDLYTFGTIDLVNYTVTQQYLGLLRDTLSPEKAVRFSRRSNKLFIDMNWSRDGTVGSWIIIEAYRVMDARVYPEIYDDMLLKRYLTALIKRQWGANLSKFNNIQMLGGVTFNGAQLFLEANAEIKEIQDRMQASFELPPMPEVG